MLACSPSMCRYCMVSSSMDILQCGKHLWHQDERSRKNLKPRRREKGKSLFRTTVEGGNDGANLPTTTGFESASKVKDGIKSSVDVVGTCIQFRGLCSGCHRRFHTPAWASVTPVMSTSCSFRFPVFLPETLASTRMNKSAYTCH